MSCVQRYLASSKCDISKPPDGAVLAPWVEVTIAQEGNEQNKITVGNLSSPKLENSAVVTSFEYAKSHALKGSITIHDQQGSSIEQFVQNMIRDFRCLEAPYNVAVEFGWAVLSCGRQEKAHVLSSYKSYAMIEGVNTNFSNGKIVYTVNINSKMETGQQGSCENTIGGDGMDAAGLKDAIKKLLQSPPPPIIKEVQFCKLKDGECIPVGFRLGEKGKNKEKQPHGKWPCNAQDKLRTIIRWLEGWVSENNKAFIPYYDDNYPGGRLLIIEDPKQDVDGGAVPCVNTYIVNGGKDSRVLSFNPSLNWLFVHNPTMGGQIGNTSIDPMNNQGHITGSTKHRSLSRAKNPGMGNPASVPTSENHDDAEGQGGTKEAHEANEKMARAFKISDSIEADLVILGDPTLNPLTTLFQFVSVIFINPFHLIGGYTGGKCGEWLALPPCNEVLSNNKWIVEEIVHRIELGKYTTTLKLSLPAPGSDIDIHKALGGSQVGWRPPPPCSKAT